MHAVATHQVAWELASCGDVSPIDFATQKGETRFKS